MQAGAPDPRHQKEATGRPPKPPRSPPPRRKDPKKAEWDAQRKQEREQARRQAKQQKAIKREQQSQKKQALRKQKDALRQQKALQQAEKKQQQRRRRAEERRARRANREARRLAIRLGLQELARRLGRLIWPPYTRRLPRSRAIVVFLLNIAPFPGLGTAIYGKWERGIMQFLLTFVFLIGWAWAILDGTRVVIRAFEPERRTVERERRGASARR